MDKLEGTEQKDPAIWILGI